jgi:D-beta-D-heptose 7-phosphate kinase/D-beta-D-heptose 1-phosphate adenosyltransferase
MVKVLVIGELCIDRFIYGKVSRMCPEAPVPVLNPTEIVENNGMAGNVVDNLNALMDDIEVIHWHQSNKIEKIRFVEKKSNQMIVRVDEGEMVPIDQLIYLSPEQKKTISESDIVIISDYNKGFLPNNTIIEISNFAKLLLMDSKKKLDYELIEKIDFIKLNEVEYKNNKELVDEYAEKFLITLGADGAKHNSIVYPSKNPQDTIDVSGAGDTFISSFSLMYYKTKDIEKSIEYANDTCANVVNKKGVVVPDESFKI